MKDFRLRKRPLYVEQVEQLAINNTGVTSITTETLAALYWDVGLEANDVELVSAPKRCYPPGAGFLPSTLGNYSVWQSSQVLLETRPGIWLSIGIRGKAE